MNEMNLPYIYFLNFKLRHFLRYIIVSDRAAKSPARDGPALPRAEGYRPGPARVKKARAGPRAFCIFSIFSFLV
jgi:hypothetical protein